MAMSECCSSSFGASCEKEHVRIDHREAFAYARSLPMLDYQRKLCSCRVNYYDKVMSYRALCVRACAINDN
eukprot:4797-Heterococcus_DN1.PRE.1